MLEQYEQEFSKPKSTYMTPIMTQQWQANFAHHYGSKVKEEPKVNQA